METSTDVSFKHFVVVETFIEVVAFDFDEAWIYFDRFDIDGTLEGLLDLFLLSFVVDSLLL